MPRRAVRSKRRYGKKRVTRSKVAKRRRLNVLTAGVPLYSGSKSKYKGQHRQAGMYGLPEAMGYGKGKYTRGRSGASVPDAATGAARGFRAGRRRRMGTILARRKKSILKVIADSRYPVIKDHQLNAVGQLDWTSGTQCFYEANVGYTTDEFEQMNTQANSAQTVSTGAIIVPNVETLVNQRMDVYDKITKYNMKNTCSHTVYIEVQAYVANSFHGYTFARSWDEALASDDMLQNPLNYGTEEIRTDIGKRPDMKYPQLNCRWKRRKDATFKIALEPGQETSYTYVQAGGRFDQQKYNILQGNSGTGDDIQNMPRFSSTIIIFARSEMVADAADADVTYGSGHIAINREVKKSWAAVPYLKPMQTSFQNSWGTVIEANELDLNQYAANNDVYEEQV